MFISNLILLFILIKSSSLTTLTKTYPTIDLKENIPKHTNIFQLTREVKNLKLVLLNLGGFESNLFTIKDENIFTINEIDREQLLGEKRCFDRSYCLIELHILVNDGEEYWVIPIHITDENDNKPEFKNSSIELKFHENIFGGYKILFEGAKDLDEGLNGKIRYILDCSNNSKKKSKNLILKENKNDSLINCFPLFEFEIISQSLINQFDQLALKFIPPKLNEIIENEYNLVLYAIDYGLNHNALFNFMNINIKIEKILRKPKFLLNEYEFIIKVNSSQVKKGAILGNVNAESNDKRKRILYRIINKTINFIEINSLTGQLFISNDNIINDEIHLLIEASYLLNENEDFKSFTKVKIFIRSINYLNNISFNINIQSSFIQQLNNLTTFSINKNTLINENLFQLTVSSSYYPSDKYILLLDNYYSTFSIISASQLSNNFILKLSNYLISNSIYLLNFRIKHQLTKEILSTNFTIQLIVSDQLATISTTSSSSSSPLSLTLTSNLTSKTSLPSICNENITYFLFDFNNKNPIGKLRVIQTNINTSYFSNFFLLINQNEFIINQCRMLIDRFDDFNLNETQYELCSIDFICYNISSMNEQNPFLFHQNNATRRFSGNSILFLRPIEITILALSIVFILATTSLVLIICRLKGFHLCLTIKNYLFYGKKYGLNNAQRLSTTKMKQRVHSIVVRESRSPSFEPMQSNKSYMFNINQITRQETIPAIPLYSQSSPRQPISLSCTSSIQQDERIISNFDNEATPRTSSSSSAAAATTAFLQETNQLLDILSSNHDSHLSALASDV